MNPMIVNQNRAARLTREAATPVYSTDTVSAAERERARQIRWSSEYEGEEFCFVCSRATDHRGEHDDEQLLRFYNSPRGKWFRR